LPDRVTELKPKCAVTLVDLHSASHPCVFLCLFLLQVCTKGFFLSEKNECLPCNCKGHAYHCEDITGVCINCRDHSTGDFCQMCEDGFMPTLSLDRRHTCRPCACPLSVASNNFAVRCDRGAAALRCKCQEGYAGPVCERCAPGYYGNPMVIGSSCKRCDCNGNSDPNLIFNECHNVTGHCQHCWGNTAGASCERCAPGFYGDAISAKNCRECGCNKCGTSSCDDRTGVCHCKPGVSGRLCDRCEEGYSGFSSCQGCRRCECGPASIRPTCHPLTHSCPCRPGAGGRYCERCLPGFWDYSPSGCQKCDCESGYCDTQTGECLAEAATVNCDDCIWHLIGDLRLSNKTLDQLKVGVLNISTGAAANDRLKYFNYTAHRLQVDVMVFCTLSIWDWSIMLDDFGPFDTAGINMKTPRVTETSSLIVRSLLLVVLVVLRRVRQMEKKLMMTDNRLFPLREGLSHFSAGLSEAQDHLLKAASTVKETEDRNRASILKFQRNEVIFQDPLPYSCLKSFLPMESSCPDPVEPLLTHLCVSMQNVSEYHAAIDGAAQKLTEKAERLSLADRDLVQRADRHAARLDQQAEQLEEDLKESDANGFVQKAISAANVYNNIVKYIDDANITSLTTFNLSQRAEDVGGLLVCRLLCRNRSITPGFVHLFSFSLERKHVPGVLTAFLCLFADRTAQRLNFTMEVAEETLNRSAEVLQTIVPISSKVEQWASNMKNNEYSTTAYQEAVDSAGEAVENLNVLVPELLDKLRVVEEKRPVNNVTTNIMRIRELIAQARSVAKKVQVSMKFDGRSSVEIHPHSNLEDLKTVTSISLFMRVDPDRDPIEDRFILYLGDRNGRKDYMGLAIKNDNLVFVYNLGGEDVEISLGSKPVSQWPAVFNYVKIERLGRHGKVFLTIPSQSSTDEQKFIQKGQAPGTDSLFDIDPKDMVFSVGGVPPGVKLPPPLILAPFVGCIELASLNNDVISLYNFKETHGIDIVASPPCPRYKLAFSQSRIASYLFDGTGYALINNIERRAKFGVVTRFDIAVRTVANDGVLFLMVNGDNFFLLELKNGFLRLMYDFGFSNGPKLLENNLPKLLINDARYHEVSVIYHQSKKVILLVDKSHVKSMENPKTTLPFSDIYIGGAPSSVLQSRPELSSVVGLKGCVKGFQFQKKDFNLLEEPGTIGISSGCPEESFMSHKAYFNGESYLGSTAKISPLESFEGGLNFRTLLPSGLLFYHSEGSEEFSISLENGAVVLNNRGTKVKSHKKQYNDGQTHFLVASVNGQKYSLLVDDKDKQEKKRPASATGSSSDPAAKSFYFGGSPKSSFKNFTGCISYAYINRQDRDIEPEDFQRYTEKVHTTLQDCPVQRPPAALLSKPRSSQRGRPHSVTRDKPSIPPGLVELKSDDPELNIETCYLSPSPRATREAFYYGGIANSRQHYGDIPESFSERSHFSLSMKTHSSSGIIFYVADDLEDNFMALVLVQGRLIYMFNVGEQQVEVRTRAQYNNGLWHNIIFIRDGSAGRLVIDGLVVLEDQVESRNISWNVSSPFYIGGVPPGRAQKTIQGMSAHGFTGCLKNLQLDGQWLSSVAETFGVTPCFQGRSEPGTFFSEEGGFVLLDQSFHLGLKFDLVLGVRPRVAVGLLLHVHTPLVVVLVNDGTDQFFTQVSPPQGVCDGTWHRIRVRRDVNVVHLDVDSQSSHVVGPVHLGPAGGGEQVFIGGAPGESALLPDGAPIRKPYVGCVRNLSINFNRVSFDKAALVSGAVKVADCPAA
uniref:Laminin, alpha 4 n=1 Tax=Salarias fasciatus TaxID=181472 RepID=A0A672IHM2_SALFA